MAGVARELLMFGYLVGKSAHCHQWRAGGIQQGGKNI
jgi:hypothetical protein